MNDTAYEILPSWSLERNSFDPRLDHIVRAQKKLPSNEVSTTKYTKWNFLAKNIFLQMHRFANVYFVFLVIINFIPATQALDPRLSIFPPVFVIFTSLVKDLYENIRLSRSDDSVNCTRAERITVNGKPEEVKWKDLRPGDVIRLYVNDIVPADIVLLYTSDERSICYVDTMDLDGETNLKQKEIVVKKGSIPFEFDDFLKFGYFIRAEAPNVDLTSFHGSFESYTNQDQSSVIYHKNILLRGSAIRNTDSVFGMIVYAGTQSKAVMNNGEKRNKVSTFEKLMNGDIAFGILFLFAMCIITACMNINNGEEIHWYIPAEVSGRLDFVRWIFAFMTMLIILQNIIPISLYVSLEIVKLVQVWMIQQDIELYSELSDSSVSCRTLNIAEELGNIQHVFCDKTGTLTENSMVFREMSVEGEKYIHLEQAKMIRSVTKGNKNDKDETKHALQRVLSGNKFNNTSREGSRRGSIGRPNRANPNRARPKSHHRRVLSDSNSLRNQILNGVKDENDFDEIVDQNFMLESTVKPDYNLKGRLHEELAISGKRQGDYSSKTLDMFLSLAVCNTVVISVEQQKKTITLGKSRKKRSLLTPKNFGRQIRKSFEKSLSFGNKAFTLDESSSGKKDLPAISENSEGTETVSGEPRVQFASEVLTNTPIVPRSRPTSLLMIPNTLPDTRPSFDALDSTLTPRTDGGAEVSVNELRPEDALYEAESPDEAALVNCAKGYGVSLMKRELNRVLVKWPNLEHLSEYNICATLPFDSTRKMMSVIIQEDGRHILLTKGADTAVFDRLRSDQSVELRQYESHVDEYATAGLRTLAFARKTMTKEEVTMVVENIHNAEKDLYESEALLQEVYSSVENDLELLGVTAIEDRLQDGVPETIRDLRRAGLAVWVLTGDKLQTAMEIGKLCNLIKGMDKLFKLDCDSRAELTQQLRSMTSYFTEELDHNRLANKSLLNCLTPELPNAAVHKPNTIMIITGKNLKWAFEEHEKGDDVQSNFLKIASACEAVICCRVTPLQKSLVVEKIGNYKNVRTLAIGDGANDVSMIQAANVGIGISGKEGRQAVLVSDFAVPRFKFLSRLLFVHGHWNFARLAYMIKYFFFKNTVFVLPTFFFQFICLSSTEKDRLEPHIYFYNTIYTSAMPVVGAVCDRILCGQQLADNPHVYHSSSNMNYYTRFSYVGAFLEAVWHGIVQFVFIYFGYRSSTGQNINPYFHTSIDLAQFSHISVLVCVLSGFCSYALDLYAINWIMWLFFSLSMIVVVIIDFAYGIFVTSNILEFRAYEIIFRHGVVYLLVPLVVLVCTLPKIFIKIYQNEFNPTEVTQLKLNKRFQKKEKAPNCYAMNC